MKTWVGEFDVFGYFDSWAVYQLFSYIRYEWGNVNYQDYQTYQKCECPWVVTGTWFNCCLEGDSCNRGDRVDAANGNMAFMAHVSIKVRQLTAWECLFNTLILAVTNSSDLTTNALPCFPIGVLPHCAAFSLLDWLDFGWLVCTPSPGRWRSVWCRRWHTRQEPDWHCFGWWLPRRQLLDMDASLMIFIRSKTVFSLNRTFASRTL